jgi:hypothetical protein
MFHDRPREVEDHVAAGDPDADPPWHRPSAVAPQAPAAAVDVHDVFRPGRRSAGREHRAGGQVADQPGQLIVGPRGQGGRGPLAEFFGGDAPVAGRRAQQLDDPVAVVVRGTQLSPWHGLIAPFPRRCLVGHTKILGPRPFPRQVPRLWPAA